MFKTKTAMLPECLTAPKASSGIVNYIRVSHVDDRSEVRIQIYLNGEATSWINMDGEEVDELIRNLQMYRAELTRDRRG